MLIWTKNTPFCLANLRICDLQNGTPRNFADLRFADLCLRNKPKNLRICVAENQKKMCVPTFGR